MVILTDTDIIIEHLRIKEKEKTAFHKIFIEEKHISAIALTTITEIWQGKSMVNNLNRLAVEDLIESIEIVLPTLETAKMAGDFIRKLNYSISFTDANIAACSIYYNLPLLTKNKKDFMKIKGLKLYSSE